MHKFGGANTKFRSAKYPLAPSVKEYYLHQGLSTGGLWTVNGDPGDHMERLRGFFYTPIMHSFEINYKLLVELKLSVI